MVQPSIDALRSPTLKHLRERWWDDEFTEFLTETLRWGFHKNSITDIDTAKKIIDKVNREDLWLEAAKEAGFSDIPTSTSRGVETFFDGTQFDPENPEAYLNSLAIKRI